MSELKLRQLVRLIIESEERDRDDDDAESPENLLLEPDGGEKKQETGPEEGSMAAAGGGGPAMPLGAGPSYPGPERRSAKKAHSEIARVTGRAFGGGSPARKK